MSDDIGMYDIWDSRIIQQRSELDVTFDLSSLGHKEFYPLKLRALFLTMILGACSQEVPPPISSQGPFYEAHCKEPLPVFTLGENSNPTKDQEIALCTCIWNNLGRWERETSEKIAQGKESEISWLNKRAFPARFGAAMEKCGGMKL